MEAFQELSAELKMTIAIGAPMVSDAGVEIGANLFDADGHYRTYTKQRLHEDEFPFFVANAANPHVTLTHEKSVFLGICHETMFEAPFEEAAKAEAEAYIALVAKPANGVERGAKHYAAMAKKHQLPVLMANAVGACEGFESRGESAIWGPKGELLGALSADEEGLLFFDFERARGCTLQIQRAEPEDEDALIELYARAGKALLKGGIDQWDASYPDRPRIHQDIQRGEAFVLRFGEQVRGAIVLNAEADEEYDEVTWQGRDSDALIVHRLAIAPKDQGAGFAQDLMRFAFEHAQERAFQSIRLDVFSENTRAIGFYERLGFERRGQIHFPRREAPFYCFEKALTVPPSSPLGTPGGGSKPPSENG